MDQSTLTDLKLPDVGYYYEGENEVVTKFDRKNKKFYIKSEGDKPSQAVEVPFTHKWIELSYMHGKAITEKEYNEF